MIRYDRPLIYLASFLCGSLLWLGVQISVHFHPFAPFKHPVFFLVVGFPFPSGAPLEARLIGHMLQTWLPFLCAYFLARYLSQGRARITGAIAVYIAFTIWSAGMFALGYAGFDLRSLILLGCVGTFLGGGVLYLGLVDPRSKTKGAPSGAP